MLNPSGPERSTPSHASDRGDSPEPGFTWRAAVLAIALTIACGFWVRQAEIVVLATQITESVPPVPALAVLLALVALNPLLLRVGRRLALSRGELLAIYCFVGVAVSILGVGVVRFWLSLLTAPFYFASDANRFATLHASIPDWLAVKDAGAIHDLYVRNPSGEVPWQVWWQPLLAWTVFFSVLWACMLCMLLLVQRRWIHAERLSFPIVTLPLEITASAGRRDQPRFFRDRVMWAGFALAALYNLLNILNALHPSVPAPGRFYDLTPALQSPHLKSLGDVRLWYRPDLIGFGFLVPSEILFSIWFFYLLGRLEALLMARQALDLPGAPFEQEQSIGAFLLMGVWLLWQARQDITAALFGTGHARPPADAVAPRWAAWGFLGSLIFLCGFCVLAGMAAWVALAYLSVVLLVALVCARIRAEAGVPLIWLFPFYQQKKFLLFTLGMAPFAAAGLSTMVLFAMLTFLARGYFPSLIGYQIEGLKIAAEACLSRRRTIALLLLAVPIGLLVACYVHLTTYYHLGAQNLRGGIWGTSMSIQEYTEVVAAQSAPARPDPVRTLAAGAGAAVAGGLLFLRNQCVGFPLHPIGYAVATAYGSLAWWPFLLVWLCKCAILRLGGLGLYRRAVPFFLGFALGHFFVAGVAWGLLGAFWEEGARAYPVWFG
ncbi:MAG: DUF6785 family protein [Chloroherpetonaceae bacterium]|nr:DUF6785 family protein [Chloroherpetonaceae bacterium]